MNILQSKACELNDEEKVLIIKKLARKGGLQIIQTFTNSEKQACYAAEGLFKMISEKVKQQHNKTTLLLQYCKLSGNSEESTWEWMGRLWVKAADSKYMDNDRRL